MRPLTFPMTQSNAHKEAVLKESFQLEPLPHWRNHSQHNRCGLQTYARNIPGCIYVIVAANSLKTFLGKLFWTSDTCREYFVCACLVVAATPLCWPQHVPTPSWLNVPLVANSSFGRKQFLWSQHTANRVCSGNFSHSYFTTSVQRHLHVANRGEPDLNDLPRHMAVSDWLIVVSALHGSLVIYAPLEFLSSLIFMIDPRMMGSFISRVWPSSMLPPTFLLESTSPQNKLVWLRTRAKVVEETREE